jgi:hypothetical protein
LCGNQLKHIPAFVFVPSVFWEKTNSRILNDTGRNSLLGHRKKIAKFLKRTFACRSTFLYGEEFAHAPVLLWIRIRISSDPDPEKFLVNLF